MSIVNDYYMNVQYALTGRHASAIGWTVSTHTDGWGGGVAHVSACFSASRLERLMSSPTSAAPPSQRLTGIRPRASAGLPAA